jgi:predicted nucleic acid-binding protein
MSDIFLDTVGLIALWDETDQWQEAASRAMATLNVPGIRYITTTYILLECGNAAARKPYRRDVCLLRDRLDREGCLIVPTDADLAEAWTAYQRGDATSAGIVDHISFAVMRRLGITEAFTNDRHFRSAGFHTLF